MHILDQVYFNSFSTGALLPVLFHFFLTVLFLFTIPKKTRATYHLGMALGFQVLFNLAYFVAGSYYDSLAAYHRWVTVSTVLFSTSHANMFIFYMYNEKRTPLSIALLSGQYLLAAAVSAFFIYSTIDMGKMYHFDGNYWDFNADGISATVAMVISFYIGMSMVICVWKCIVLRDKRAWHVLALLGAYMVIAIPPNVFNTLSRQGMMDRAVFQVTWDLFNVFGLFLLAVLYINISRERTKFITKIVSISLVTFLVLFQILTYYSSRDQDRAFDKIYLTYAQQSLQSNVHNSETAYIVTYEAETGRISNNYSRNQSTSNLDFSSYDVVNQNSLLLEKIRSLHPGSFMADLEELIQNAHPTFAGHGALILEDARQLPADSTSPGILLNQKLEARKRNIKYRYNKLAALPTDGFQARALKRLEKSDKEYAAFTAQVLQVLKTSQDRGLDLKNNILKMYLPVSRAGARQYRNFNNKHFIAYSLPTPDGTSIQEVGFDYLSYREYLHNSAERMSFLLVLLYVMILLGYRFFFRGALNLPLSELEEGIKNIRGGQLDIKVPIRSRDEIGFLARGFNTMAENLKASRNSIQDYADNLEQKVKTRTEELEKTFNELHTLKVKQDGDYFLTSLLLKPLQQNANESNAVRTEFQVRQFKKFTFRKKSSEIGGDYCVTESLTLSGKQFTFFVNADAMGKSIQGAGGALIFGAFMRARLSHIRSRQNNKAMPEIWLRDTYQELQSMFETFDGSMLISAVFGLVDQTTGLMYYINAEHPFVCLYRKSKASFIEDNMTLRKLGSLEDTGELQIKLFQLRPQDQILIGSDGKDDITIEGQDGTSDINYDEHLFLKWATMGQGNLNKILDLIEANSELKDDISLLSLNFQGDPVEIKSESPPEHESLIQEAERLLSESNQDVSLSFIQENFNNKPFDKSAFDLTGRIYKDKNNFKEYAKLLKKYYLLRPSDAENIMNLSRTLYLLENIEEAIRYTECLHLRDPSNIKCNLLLAKLYIKAEQPTPAVLLIEKVLEIQPQNEAAQRIQEYLSRKEEQLSRDSQEGRLTTTVKRFIY